MRVIAIDPGYGRCGMAVLERQSGKDVLLFSTCIETAPADDFITRLFSITSACREIIETHRPEHFAIEKLFFNSNQKTAMRVAEVRGALLNLAREASLPVFEYTPGEIKSATTSSGRADKKQIIAMIHMLIKIEKEIRHDDEYDAIAVGVTHMARHGAYAAHHSHTAR